MSHVFPVQDEVNGNLLALNAFAGIPLSSISGFRAPFLNYSRESLQLLGRSQFVVRLVVTLSLFRESKADFNWILFSTTRRLRLLFEPTRQTLMPTGLTRSFSKRHARFVLPCQVLKE
jgi:hypothetical protein